MHQNIKETQKQTKQTCYNIKEAKNQNLKQD